MKISIDFKKYIIAVALGMCSMMVLISLFAAVMLLLKIDRAYSALFATVSVACGAYISSYYISRKSGSKGYMIGILTGVMYFLGVTVISLAVSKSHIGSNTAFHFVIILLSATVGGIMGVNKKKPKIL